MVEVGMGMENTRDRQSKLVHLVENSLVCSTGIDHDRLLRHWIADDQTIATKGGTEKVFRIMTDMMHACYRPSPSRRKQRLFIRRLLKKSVSFVLGSSKSSTYPLRLSERWKD